MTDKSHKHNRSNKMNQKVTHELQTQDFTPVKYEGAFSNATNFEAAQRMAQALCSSSMVPKHYQGNGNIGNTIIALEMSQRMNASPLLIMQNLYLVHGNPGWSAKFLIATFNQSGRFTAIQYEWKGTAGQKDRACRAYAEELRTGNRVEGPWIDWPLIDGEGWARKNGSKWLTMPEKMFAYRAAAWLVDTVAPEISMGLPPADQLEDIIDINPRTGEVIDIHSKKTTLADLKENSPRQTETREEAPAETPVNSTEKNEVAAGQVTDSSGEIFNPEIHATGKDGKPVYITDGSFRARRGSHKKEAQSSAVSRETPETQPQVESGVSFAGIAEMINMAETRNEIDSAMVHIDGLPDEQKGELRSLAREKSKQLASA
jgi:hypothetical protein